MSTPTPTPRTDAQNFGASCATDFCRTLERENAALRENCEAHEKYAHMMQEQRSQIAAYCRTLERELATERARLDWLQAQEVKRGLEITEGRDDPLPFLVLGEDGTTHWGDTYRAAIDAAMKTDHK